MGVAQAPAQKRQGIAFELLSLGNFPKFTYALTSSLFFSYFFETTRQGYKLLEGRLRCENSELCCAEGEILLAPFKGDDSAFLIKESRYVMKNNIAK